jgi:hypothetical protein
MDTEPDDHRGLPSAARSVNGRPRIGGLDSE